MEQEHIQEFRKSNLRNIDSIDAAEKDAIISQQNLLYYNILRKRLQEVERHMTYCYFTRLCSGDLKSTPELQKQMLDEVIDIITPKI